MVTVRRSLHSENGRTKSQYFAENHTFITVVKAKTQYNAFVGEARRFRPTNLARALPYGAKSPTRKLPMRRRLHLSKAVAQQSSSNDNTPDSPISAPPNTTHHTLTMSVSALIRCATRARAAPFARPAQRALFVQQPVQRAAFSVSAGRFAGDVDAHDPHHEESFEEFTARYAVPVSAVFWEGRTTLEIAMAGGEVER